MMIQDKKKERLKDQSVYHNSHRHRRHRPSSSPVAFSSQFFPLSRVLVCHDETRSSSSKKESIGISDMSGRSRYNRVSKEF